jgi:Domain of unknown function (DUF1993)
MSYSLYDAAVAPCIQQLGALAGIIDKAAAHCADNKIEESALLQDRLYPDMFCLARQIRQSADFGMNTGGRLAGVSPPALPAVDDTSFAAAKSRVETALGFREVADSRMPKCRKKSKVLMGSSVCLQFMNELLPNDGDLMRRSWHSIPREFWDRRLLLDTARAEDRHLQRTDWETRDFILWQLLSGRRTWCSKREDR